MTAAEALTEFIEAFNEPLGAGVRFLDTVTVSAMQLYESLRGELGLHHPEMDEEHLDKLAEYMVLRVFRDVK